MARAQIENRRTRMRDILIHELANCEQLPDSRKEWLELLRPHMKLPKHAERDFSTFFRAHFTAEEEREIEALGINRRLGNMHSRVSKLLERLWERGMDGDTTAAKEFLNRMLGQAKQQVLMQHEVSDSMQDLLSKIRPTEAYQRPQIDENGNEIIEAEVTEQESLPDGSNDEAD